MKKLLLVTLILLTGISGFSQLKRAEVRKSMQDVSLPYLSSPVEIQAPVQEINPVVANKSVLVPDIIGNTFYDLQTNGAMQQRIYHRDDGKMAAVWTRGITSTAYPDRGTGYNFYDGTAWGPAPTSRIESIRTGWPSIAMWNGTGEIAVAHQAAGPLVLMKRTTAGTGTWTFSNVEVPTGAPWPFWPAIMTSGPNHEIIHILAMTQPEANGGAVWNNLDGALLYWRSSDGGQTWEKNGVQLPQLMAPEYIGFSADSYIWANPKGDTIAFAYGDNWADEVVMVSHDNGDNWTKTTVLTNQYKAQPAGTIVDPFYSTDGSSAIGIDKNGIIHLAFGRMRNSEGADGRVWYPYTDGLIYWNSTMPPVQDSLNLDTLWNHNQLIGYVETNQAGDSIISIPYYNASMSSYPNLLVDNEGGRILVIYSGIVVDNPSNDQNFRHIKGTGTNDVVANYGAPLWLDDMVDFNEGIDDMYLEFVFPFMARENNSDYLHYIVQSSDVPGTNILQTTVPVHDNNIIYNNVLKDDIVAPGIPIVGISKEKKNLVSSLSNFPNPFNGTTTVSVGMAGSSHATLEVANITGQVLRTIDLGVLPAGNSDFRYDGSSLSAGIYLVTIRANGSSMTCRMIVR